MQHKETNIKAATSMKAAIAMYQPHQHIFPARLDGFNKAQALGGGTNSVFSIKHEASGQQFVLKFGAHVDAGKIEMLCNVVYQALGVKVPKRCIYRELPSALAKDLNFNAPAGVYQVSEFIQPHHQQSKQLICVAARQDFAAHALLGNIDVAKTDNFILDQDGNTVLIDAGANFLFRAKGEARKEHPALASEIDTLRDETINPGGHAWFASLTDAEIAAQVQALLAMHAVIEQAVWDAANQLELPEELRNRFLEFLSDRLDQLATRFCRVSQQHAKTDKKSHDKKTAAGVLTYTMKNGEPHVLLSQRVRHQWWDNFGGKSEQDDHYLVDTARREVAEESSQQLNYTTLELNASPCHDLVTGEGVNQQIYRLYISPYREINPATLNDAEHGAHQWVPLAAVMQAVTTGKPVLMEGVYTVVVEHSKQSLPLFPPLLQMLQQPAVRDNLQSLIQTGKMKVKHTLGFADNAAIASHELNYLPLVTPVKKRQQIAVAVKHKSAVLREIKRAKQVSSEKSPAMSAQLLTQSEVHLKSMLGADYREGQLEANVRLFVTRTYGRYSGMCSREQQDRIIRMAVGFIENERNGGEDQFYFYHGCSNKISFAYEIYTRLYQALHADADTAAFRPDSAHFQRFMGITEFIAFYSGNNQKTINNNDKYFHDCALSANVFLFGNHNTPTSSSIHYLVNNDVSRDIDLEILFSNLLRPFHVSAEEIKRLLQVFETCAKHHGGSLYQIAMSKEQAQQMAYPAAHMGKLFTLDDVRDLPCIMLALQNRNLSDRAMVKYLSELQARLLVPPQLKLRVNTVKWEQADQVQQQQYHHELQQCADFIFDLILRHHSAVHGEYNSTAVLKVLPAILAANQVSANTTVNTEVLVRAIIVNDAVTVSNIFQSHPEFLEETFSLPAEYLKGDRNQHCEKLPLIDLILKHSSLPFNVLPVNYVASQLQHFVVTSHQNGGLQLNKIVARLPEAERYQFAMQMASSCRFTAADLFLTLNQLPEHLRLLFVEDLVAWYRFGRDTLENFTTLMSGTLYQDMLACIPVQHRSRFVRSFYTVTRIEMLVTVLGMLPDSERLDYLNYCYNECQPDVNQLVAILLLLPEDQRLGYLVGYQHLVTSGISLGAVLAFLPLAEREAFARHHQFCIKNGDDLCRIVQQLPQQDALVYARRYIKIIKEAPWLHDILKCLPQAERVGIAVASKVMCRDAREYGMVVAVLGKDNWAKYFAVNTGVTWIKNGSNLAVVIKALPMEDKSALATLLHHKIKDFDQLYEVVRVLPAADRVTFLAIKKSMIDDCLKLASILTLLPYECRVEFALVHDAILYAGYEIAEVTRSIHPAPNRNAFLQSQHHKINRISGLLEVLLSLEEAERIPWAQLKKHLINNIGNLIKVLKLLPAAERAAFAASCYKLMKDVDAIPAILKHLQTSDVLPFIQPLLDKAENRKLYYLVLNYLPDSQWLEFVKLHYKTILEFCSVEQLVSGATKAERDKILSYCQEKMSVKPEYSMAGAGMKLFDTKTRTPQAIDAFLGNTVLPLTKKINM